MSDEIDYSLYEMRVTGPVSVDSIDTNNKLTETRNCGYWVLVPEEGIKKIDKILEDYERSAFGFISSYSDSLKSESQVPWALVCLDREYDLVSEFKYARGNDRGLGYMWYSMSSSTWDDISKHRVSVIVVNNKNSLYKAPQKSKFLAFIRDILQGVGVDNRWFIVINKLAM
ncbi:MAG: hypothetical protein JAZ19_08715 [Candidatus Thiodiazotropha taylori]|nr:hypothetical protein [Candidatus Thiodiazotropha taylori]